MKKSTKNKRSEEKQMKNIPTKNLMSHGKFISKTTHPKKKNRK